MITFLLPLSFGITNFINYGLTYLFQFSRKQSSSISSITNSMIVTTSCIFYLNNYITYGTLYNCFIYNSVYLTNDIVFNYFYDINNNFVTKLIHHIISYYAIYRLPFQTEIISVMFATELSNIPLENINILKNINYNKYFLRELNVIALYTIFFGSRIVYPVRYVYTNYNDLTLSKYDWIMLVSIYLLWNYWFLLINKKVYQKIIKKYL